jgi:hypothetical protein
VVTTSTTILAFKWPSATTAQLVVSIRHIEDPAPHGLGGARVPLAESKHKRTSSRSCCSRRERTCASCHAISISTSGSLFGRGVTPALGSPGKASPFAPALLQNFSFVEHPPIAHVPRSALGFFVFRHFGPSDEPIKHLLDLIRKAAPFSSRPAPPTKWLVPNASRD